jgi:hypothetical protein
MGNKTSHSHEHCTCKLKNFTEQIRCLNTTTGLFGPCSILIYEEVAMGRLPLPNFNKKPFCFPDGSNKRDELQMNSTTVTWVTPLLTVLTYDLPDTFVFILINSLSLSFACSSPCEIVIPNYALVNTAIMNVKVFVQDVKTFEQSYPITASDTCGSVSLFSPEIMTKFNCFPLWEQVCIILAFTVTILGILALSLYLIKCCCSCYVQRYKIDWTGPQAEEGARVRGLPMSSLCILLMLFIPPASFDVDPVGFDLKTSNYLLFPKEKQVKKRSSLKSFFLDLVTNKFFIYTCLVSLLVTGASAQCTATTVISSSAIVCTMSGNTQTCDLTMNTLASLPALGSQICAVILDSNEKRIGTMNITYVSAQTVVQLSPLYFTSRYNPFAQSARVCQNDNHCPLGGGCQSPISSFQQDLFTSPIGLWPGRQQCQASCGCAGCGCFFCSDACLYSAWALVPTNDIYQVFDLISAFTSPTVKFDLELGGSVTSNTFSLSAAPFVVNSKWQFTLIGNFQGASTLFGSKKLIVGSGGAFLGSASDLQSPTWDTIGDIQASSAGAFLSASTNAFIFSPLPVANTAGQSSVTYQFPPNGLSHLPEGILLPALLGPQLWTYTGTSLVGFNSQPGAVQFSVSTTSAVHFSYLVTSICPRIDSPISVAGCFNCQLGFTLSLLAHSSCGSGRVDVTVQSPNKVTCYTPTALLPSAAGPITISCSSLDKSVSGLLILSYQNNVVNATFNAVLNNPPPLTQAETNNIVGNSTVLPHVSDFSTLWDSLTGTAGIAKYFITIVVGIVVLAVLAAVLFGVAYGVKKALDYRTEVYGPINWNNAYTFLKGDVPEYE